MLRPTLEEIVVADDNPTTRDWPEWLELRLTDTDAELVNYDGDIVASFSYQTFSGEGSLLLPGAHAAAIVWARAYGYSVEQHSHWSVVRWRERVSTLINSVGDRLVFGDLCVA